MKKLKYAALSLLLSLMSFGAAAPALASAQAPLPVMADTSALKSDACAGINQVDPSQGCGTKGDGVTGIIQTVVKILSYIVGIAAIIMIIVAGFRYITSGGDSGKIGTAKSTLIYALVGLAIVALAQGLVHFVLNTASHAANGG